MLRFPFIAIALLLFTRILLAQLPDNLILDADRIHYDKEAHALHASGNVSLTYQNFTVTSSVFTYNTMTHTVHFPEPLRLFNASQSITADSLHYWFLKGRGTATGIHLQTPNLTFHAQKLTVNRSSVRLQQTSLTTCNHFPPHYAIHSEKATLYPMIGLLVARNNRIQVSFLPFSLRTPYFIYGTNPAAILGEQAYLPEFGTNKTQGVYAIYKFAYILSPLLSGSINLGYSEKLQWILGGNTLYSQTPKLRHGSHYHWYPNEHKLSLYHETRYTHTFYKPTKKALNFIDQLSQQFNTNPRNSTLAVGLFFQQDDLTNDYWVSHLPGIILKNMYFKDNHLDSETTFTLSKTRETDSRTPSYTNERFAFSHMLLLKKPLSPRFVASAGTTSDVFLYPQTTGWYRFFFNAGLTVAGPFQPSLTYLKKIKNTGSSPFNYERAYALNSDEIGFQLQHDFRHFRFSVDSFYTLNTGKFRQLSLSSMVKFHCWGIGFSWKSQQEAFNITATLL